MNSVFLYEKLNILKDEISKFKIPKIIKKGLSKNIELRQYQIESIKNFIYYFENDSLKKNKQVHNLFHMATGSGKTIIMAALVLYLYSRGYRNFLFFVNQTNVLEKTIDNFTNHFSSKYLFNNTIEHNGKKIKIKKVDNFSGSTQDDDIEIIFTTTQKLHLDLSETRENSLTYDDFENKDIVFISDESHHINSLTKRPTEEEKKLKKSWEYSVLESLHRNKSNVMLEFTATCDLKDENVLKKYQDKIIFNYPLVSFRESGYTKDFQNFATDTDLWNRTLIALIISEYRKFLFSELKLNIKPVILLKSKEIKESKEFYDIFFKKIKSLSTEEIQNLENIEVNILNEAINFFKNKDNSLELLKYSLKNSFTKETSIIMNTSSDNNKTNQLLVNSLEDISNPIRLIFAVDMLNEGWDVLNLFDIVRLYDTRQGSGKAGVVGNYTIKEAQLIGRAARYCPFIVNDEDLKFKRKYDNDLDNKNRILETMFFHSKNDSLYIYELKQALIETGMKSFDSITIEYILKENFKESEFYKKSYVFSNKRLIKESNNENFINHSLRTKTFYYNSITNKGYISNLFKQEKNTTNLKIAKVKNIKFKDIDLNTLLGASDFFEEFNFNFLKQKFPNLKSKIDFFTFEQFLGNANLEITYINDELNKKEIFLALKKALNQISFSISSLEQQYEGSKEFIPIRLKDVLKSKKIHLEKIDKNGGKGSSQNNSSYLPYRLDLSKEDWYVFNDNFGTSEEKLFIKYFKRNIEPKLIEKNLEYYIVRNERIPELAIYSFDTGERFEPDFLIFIKKRHNKDDYLYQGYIEPKGSYLLEQDAWKEKFLLSLDNQHSIENKFIYKNKIIGFPFFNKENKIEEFEKYMLEWIDKL